MKIRFRIQRAPSFLKMFGAEDQIIVQVEDFILSPNEPGLISYWRDATPADMVHVHEGTVS